jgi:WD40 repeat protein
LDHRVCLWDMNSGKQLHPQPGHEEAAIALGFIQDGKTLVSLGRDDTVRWWDWRTGKEERAIAWHTMLPGAVAFSRAGDLIAVGSPQGSIRLLSTASGQELGRLHDGLGATRSVAFSPDGKLLAASDGSKAQIWDVAARKLSRRLAEDAGGQLLLFAPDSKLLLGGDAASRLWDVAKDQLIRNLPLSFKTLKSAAFSPDSRMLACGDIYGKVEMWDLESAEKVRVFSGLTGYVQVLTFSPNGRTLAAGGWRGIKVWELATGHERRAFHDFEGDVFALAFTPDGRALASGVGAANILIWDIPGKALVFDPAVGDGPQFLEGLAKNLAADGNLAHQAIWGFVARPAKSVAYLRTLFKPAPAADKQAIAQLIKDLDSDVFAAREKATTALQKLGDAAEPALKKLLDDSSPPEVQERARELLQKLAGARIAPERLQVLRAIEALEYIGTPEAQTALREVAQGAFAAQVTREAAASLERLAKRKK